MIAFYYDGTVVQKHHSTPNFHQISELTPEEFGIAADAEEGWYTPERELVPPGVDVAERELTTAGGKGSGNFGHAGRPGQVGGSGTAEDTSDYNRLKEMVDKIGTSMARPMALMGMDNLALSQDAVGDYLEKNGGKEWKASPLPKGIPKGKKGECYANASRLMLNNEEYDYVEGVAYKHGVLMEAIGFLHAWVVDQKGNVIDNTWEDQEKNKYFGIKYDRKEYTAHMMKTKIFGVLGGRSKDAETIVRRGKF